MAPTSRFEAEGMARGYRIVAGVDEAGRGPWAGPVVAAAVVFQGRRIPRGLNDSKKLTAMAREVAYGKIMGRALVGIGIADVATIDRINILQATLQAMRDAVRALPCRPDLALVDGNRAPELDCAIRTVVEGDALSVSVAAASIIAKVTRDRISAHSTKPAPAMIFTSTRAMARRSIAPLSSAWASARITGCPSLRSPSAPPATTRWCWRWRDLPHGVPAR